MQIEDSAAGRAEIIERANPKYKGQADYAYINGTLHGNPIAAAAGLATLRRALALGVPDNVDVRGRQLRHGLRRAAARRARGEK